MLKSALLPLIALFVFSAAMAEEPAAPAASSEHEGGEHEEKKKPPAKPGLPTADVLKLPVIASWKKWEKEKYDFNVIAWGETLTIVDGQKCWGVAVGEARNDGMHVWRHFCVPTGGGDIWVQKLSDTPESDTVYLPYDKWVTECKPTENNEGNC